MKRILSLSAATIAALGLGVAVQATPVSGCFTFQENNASGTAYGSAGYILNQSETFTEGSLSITASGYLSQNNPIYTSLGGSTYSLDLSTSTQLFAKTGPGAAETGLGLAPYYVSQGEIPSSGAIVLDLTGLGNSLNGSVLGLGSLQSGENAMVFGKNANGNWTLLATVAGIGYTAMNTYTLNSQYSTIAISETPLTTTTSGENIITTGLCPAVPDGGTTAMMLGMALCGMVLLFARKACAA